MADNAQRLNWVDTAKGLSILLVVMMHSAFGVGELTGGTGVLHWIIAFATPFRMPEFFAISGLFLSLVVARDWKPYADRRVVHYLYFYAVWALIHIVFKVGLGTGDPATALNYLVWAVVEPYGVLWFIYLLAAFSAAAKLLHTLRAPHWLALGLGAALQIGSVHTGLYAVDQFAAYFVYFYAGYALAPLLFKLVAWADTTPVMALAAIAAWAVVNAVLVFSPGFAVLPGQIDMGLAAQPGLHLLLALAGTAALCVIASLLSDLPAMDWLRWLGSKSIVVYLAFAIPMGAFRAILFKLGVSDTSVLSVLVMAASVTTPLLLYWAVQHTSHGKFLFERPAWAHLPGTPGARQPREQVSATPAE
ncbi:acyltransferase family protein [Devosia sp.]|uniref:acyltransferase family protein n=1 Tax=Devosia sp. TaxID=1871048 RepID=UPI003263BDAC